MQLVLKTIGWGIVIYALMYLLWSGLVLYGLSAGLLSLFIRLFALLSITTIAGMSMHFVNWRDLVPVSLAWAAIAAGMDGVFLVPFSGWALYANWSVWVGYTLIALIPLIAHMLLTRRIPSVASHV